MKFNLDPQYLEYQEHARKLAHSIRNMAFEADSMSELHPGILKALQESGICSLMVPAQYGGLLEKVDPLAICVTREVFMGACGQLDALFVLQGIGSYAITVAGSEEQRTKWLPRVARAEVLAAMALTEPEAGSDLKSVTTTVSQDGDGLLLNGEKAFISNAGSAGYYQVFARDGDSYSMLLVPADTEGVTSTPAPELIAAHQLGDVHFRNVRLPKSAYIGKPGDGFKLLLATLSVFRASVAGSAVGLAQVALEEAVRHTRTRKQFGRPLAKLGPVAQMLADSWTEIEMARLLTYKAAVMAQAEPAASVHYSSMAKLAASEMASRVVDRCIQVMGRFGLVKGTKIELLYRQSRPMRIYEGSSEILRLGIASELTKIVP